MSMSMFTIYQRLLIFVSLALDLVVFPYFEKRKDQNFRLMFSFKLFKDDVLIIGQVNFSKRFGHEFQQLQECQKNHTSAHHRSI
jgi:hypothetical protein